jgi:hypothetical protein
MFGWPGNWRLEISSNTKRYLAYWLCSLPQFRALPLHNCQKSPSSPHSLRHNQQKKKRIKTEASGRWPGQLDSSMQVSSSGLNSLRQVRLSMALATSTKTPWQASFPSPPPPVHSSDGASCICLALALAAAQQRWSKHTALWVSSGWWYAPILPLQNHPSGGASCLLLSPNLHPSSPPPWPDEKLEGWVVGWRLDKQRRAVGLWAWWKRRRWVNFQFDNMHIAWISICHLSGFQVESTSKQRVWYCSPFPKLVQFGIGTFQFQQLNIHIKMDSNAD